ncbi:type VI immunity family protein [Archangium primigenium]|uniref:type VI immunity family protein n=1 Tax=[Archangium] primigenium TaxID=2792470 RepID=UPI001957F87E|nr:type VI immunity family protein [Archangium primigenium]MBM7116302.1 DUF3396 domain-containing protein [Archangium primigenium]
MSARYPRIRLQEFFEGQPLALVREGVSFSFYTRCAHEHLAPAVLRALELYLRTVGPQALSGYFDAEGDWRELDTVGWLDIRQKLLNPRGARIELSRSPDALTGHAWRYQGRALDESAGASEETRELSFSVPTEYLEQQGPHRVRDLALRIARTLPFDSGHAGMTLLFPGWTPRNTPLLRDRFFRHPGLDIPEPTLARSLGMKLKGAYWLTFLGPTVLAALGGEVGLRERLRDPGSSVESWDGAHAVVTLGEWPELGDSRTADGLPAYRALARVLEPWLYIEPRWPWGNLTLDETRRWQCRFLEDERLK